MVADRHFDFSKFCTCNSAIIMWSNSAFCTKFANLAIVAGL